MNKLQNATLTNEQIKRFKEIYKNKFDIILSDKEALNSGIALINFMKIIFHLSKK